MPSFDPDWLDRMYNNRALVPEHPAYLARWAAESARTRDSLGAHVDLRYGDGLNETLDVISAAEPDAPVLVFIHGGYWRGLDKSEHSFLARPFHERGVCVVVPNYALCPGTPEHPIGIADIALQMVSALEWTWRHIAAWGGDPSRITVAGHSAGGHLAAMLVGCDWRAVAPDLPADLVRNVLSISGLHDLRPIQHAPFIAPALKLTDADSLRLSPALWPAPKHGKLYALAGADESPEFMRQAELIRDAWGSRMVPVCESLPGLNHFSVLDALADPAQRLHGLAMDLLEA